MANRLKCEVHFATSALTKPSFQPLKILYIQQGKNPRKLTPREAARLQGFPEDFIIPVSDTQAYRQFGNSKTSLKASLKGAHSKANISPPPRGISLLKWLCSST